MRAVKTPGARLLGLLIFVRWLLLFLGTQYGVLHHPMTPRILRCLLDFRKSCAPCLRSTSRANKWITRFMILILPVCSPVSPSFFTSVGTYVYPDSRSTVNRNVDDDEDDVHHYHRLYSPGWAWASSVIKIFIII